MKWPVPKMKKKLVLKELNDKMLHKLQLIAQWLLLQDILSTNLDLTTKQFVKHPVSHSVDVTFT